jgi:hypothetical protein
MGKGRSSRNGYDAGVGGTRRGGAKQRKDCEEKGVENLDCEQSGNKRKCECEEQVNE